jgi:hypothetical protein
VVSTRPQSLEKQKSLNLPANLTSSAVWMSEWPVKMAIIHAQWRFLADPRQLAGGGCRGVLGSVSLMHAHDGAESVQIVSEGRANSGSSRVPARRIIKCGRASDELVTGVPQRSQNCRRMRLPLSAILAKSRSGPVTATAEAANTRFTVALPAARY